MLGHASAWAVYSSLSSLLPLVSLSSNTDWRSCCPQPSVREREWGKGQKQGRQVRVRSERIQEQKKGAVILVLFLAWLADQELEGEVVGSCLRSTKRVAEFVKPLTARVTLRLRRCQRASAKLLRSRVQPLVAALSRVFLGCQATGVLLQPVHLIPGTAFTFSACVAADQREVCVCVCVCVSKRERESVFVCVCECTCV